MCKLQYFFIDPRGLHKINYTLAQKQTIINCGFPSDRSSYIQAYYDDFVDNVDYLSYSSSAFGAFQVFVCNFSNITSLSGESDIGIVARGYYSEISGHDGYYLTELYHIADCIRNRRISSTSGWNTSFKAAAQSAMNAINPNHSQYLTGAPVKKPLYDSSPVPEARMGLITAFEIAWNQVGAFEGEDVLTSYSDLPIDKYYFNETYASGRHNAGNFYFY